MVLLRGTQISIIHELMRVRGFYSKSGMETLNLYESVSIIVFISF